MSKSRSPNEDKPPEQPFRYKPRRKLDVQDETLLQRMHVMGTLDCTIPETAAALGCCKETLLKFWDQYPEYRDAYEDGKMLGNVRLRRQLQNHSAYDPSTTKFLAKQKLGMSDDPAKAKADEAQAGLVRSMTQEERSARILELRAKLIGGPPEEGGEPAQHVHAEGNGQDRIERAQIAGRPAGAPAGSSPAPPEDARPRQPWATWEGPPLDAQKGTQGGDVSDELGQVSRPVPGERMQGRPVGRHPARLGPVAPETSVAALQKRLEDLEASVVRKKPRLDGAPHTDRTVAAPANSAQTNPLASDAPPRLPGRLGKR